MNEKSTRDSGGDFGGSLFSELGFAQVPADIAAKLVDMGRNVCPADTAALYRHFQPTAPYPGVKVMRDVPYGPDPREIMDVFSAKKAAATGRF